MRRHVVVAGQAERQIRTVDRWWRENRLASPELFAEELASALDTIATHPGVGRLSKGQAAYLETLVQLVEVYDAREHAIDGDGLGGVEILRHLMAEAGMSGSDLARLLGLHASMGSKILNGDRSLTLEHVRRLADHFGVRPDVLIA